MQSGVTIVLGACSKFELVILRQPMGVVKLTGLRASHTEVFKGCGRVGWLQKKMFHRDGRLA
jgi:hypothetical protein